MFLGVPRGLLNRVIQPALRIVVEGFKKSGVGPLVLPEPSPQTMGEAKRRPGFERKTFDALEKHNQFIYIHILFGFS